MITEFFFQNDWKIKYFTASDILQELWDVSINIHNLTLDCFLFWNSYWCLQEHVVWFSPHPTATNGRRGGGYRWRCWETVCISAIPQRPVSFCTYSQDCTFLIFTTSRYQVSIYLHVQHDLLKDCLVITCTCWYFQNRSNYSHCFQ